MSRMLAVLVTLLLLAFRPSSVLPAPAASSTAIRDIRGPLPPSRLPPFAATALVLAAGLGLAAAARSRKKRSRTTPSIPLPLTATDDLATLREAYARGELPAMLLFEQLAAIARSRLLRGDCEAMTSQEVLKAAADAAPEETIAVAAALLAMCDLVRFGTCLPDMATVDEAFAAAQQLLEPQPVAAP